MKSDTPRDIYAIVHMPSTGGAIDLQPFAAAQRIARRCKGVAHAIITGSSHQAMQDATRPLRMTTVWTIQAKDGADLQTHQAADAIAAACKPGRTIGLSSNALLLTSAEPAGLELGGRLAARLQATALGKCLDLSIDEHNLLLAERAIFGGRLNVAVQGRPGRYIAAVRELANQDEGLAEATQDPMQEETKFQRIDYETLTNPPFETTLLARTEEHAPLDGAGVVVTGGRGMGADEGFTYLYKLAELLGGAVGASLPAIDAGWAPVARQVGQSGKYVSPGTYIAVGVSGTAQHLAGVDPHARIVAINNDPDAAIFQVADIAVVADWRAFLPPLIEALSSDKLAVET